MLLSFFFHIRYRPEYWSGDAATVAAVREAVNLQQQQQQQEKNTTSATSNEQAASTSKPNSNQQTNQQQQQPQGRKSSGQQRPQQSGRHGNQQNQTRSNNNNNRNVGNNVQVYRVDNINFDNPQAVKDALSSASSRPSMMMPKNPITGIDLNNHASVAIVEYVPVETSNNSSDENNNTTAANNEEDDDGFKPVLTKRSRKAEKLRQAQAAAAAQAALVAKARVPKTKPSPKQPQQAQKRVVEPLMSKNVTRAQPPPSHPPSLSAKKENEPSWPGVTVSGEATATANTATPAPVGTLPADLSVKKLVSNALSATSISTTGAPLSPSVDLNLKIESTKKVWDSNEARSHAKSNNDIELVRLFICLAFIF